jgi:hypothetical protein
MYFTHSLAGALTIKTIIDKVEKDLSEKEKVVLWFVGITASVLPDFDLIYVVLSGVKNHRYFITHGVTLYLLMFLIIYLLRHVQEKKEFGRKFFKILSLVFITGVFTHLFIDILLGGIALLSPFSLKIFGFEMYLRKEGVNWLNEYIRSKYMFLELFIASVFFYTLRDKKYLVAKMFSLMYFIVALMAFVFISTTMF